jgi:peptidoglycan/xylan/chitin deacetylase (PgdA/CDA1 family)
MSGVMNDRGKEARNRFAVLSMDVEEWYHLDYLHRDRCNTSISLMDGLDRYIGVLADEQVPSSFFVLGELVKQVTDRLRDQADIGMHGWNHKRPLLMSMTEFAEDLKRTRSTVEEALGRKVVGYRAPCFSFDRPRLDLLGEMGFEYDSSRIEFGSHPLYGTVDMSGYEKVMPLVYRSGKLVEFELPTLQVLGRTVPVSGGGYLRLLPWFVMHRMLLAFLRTGAPFVLYIHPFELSGNYDTILPADTQWPSRIRFARGRRATERRLRMLIALLRQHGYTFTTFAELRGKIMLDNSYSASPATMD